MRGLVGLLGVCVLVGCGGFETDGYPGIFVLAKGPPTIDNSTLTP